MTIFAQTNDRISYQAVVRDANNNLVVNKTLTVNVTVSDGITVYTETHTVTSNVNGLISLMLGDGTSASGNWNAIKWNQASVTTAISAGGSLIGTVTMPLTAVPYSMYAKYADSVNSGVIAQQIHDSADVVRNGFGDVAADLAALAGKEQSDSALLANRIAAENAAMGQRIATDSAELKGLIDANANNISNLQSADNALAARLMADSANLAGNYYNKDVIDDTITNILGQITMATGGISDNYYTKAQVNDKENALATRIYNDSTYLKGLIDANKQAVIDSSAHIRSEIGALNGNIANTYATKEKLYQDSLALDHAISTVNTNLITNYVTNETLENKLYHYRKE